MPSEYSQSVRLARTALIAAIDRRNDAALDAVRRLWEECGANGLAIATQAWCDSFIDHATDGFRQPLGMSAAFVNTDTGALDVDGSQRVPAEVRWAARLIQARAAMDRDAYEAVVDELPDGESRRVGEHVVALLRVVASTVRNLPRGHTLMGRGVAGDA